MALILHIETATEICSVSLAKNAEVVLVKEASEPRSHASQTAVLIDEIIKESGFSFNQLDAIAVSRGPGSYTGLRIGVASAKGISYALDKPLIAIDTLLAMASTFLMKNRLPFENALLVPLIDARRQEVYGAVLNQRLQYIENVKAEILTPESFMIDHEKPRVLFGDGAAKSFAILKENNVFYEDTFRHSSIGMILPAFQAYQNSTFENIAYFEPYYLKEFVDNAKK